MASYDEMLGNGGGAAVTAASDFGFLPPTPPSGGRMNVTAIGTLLLQPLPLYAAYLTPVGGSGEKVMYVFGDSGGRRTASYESRRTRVDTDSGGVAIVTNGYGGVSIAVPNPSTPNAPVVHSIIDAASGYFPKDNWLYTGPGNPNQMMNVAATPQMLNRCGRSDLILPLSVSFSVHSGVSVRMTSTFGNDFGGGYRTISRSNFLSGIGGLLGGLSASRLTNVANNMPLAESYLAPSFSSVLYSRISKSLFGMDDPTLAKIIDPRATVSFYQVYARPLTLPGFPTPIKTLFDNALETATDPAEFLQVARFYSLAGYNSLSETAIARFQQIAGSTYLDTAFRITELQHTLNYPLLKARLEVLINNIRNVYYVEIESPAFVTLVMEGDDRQVALTFTQSDQVRLRTILDPLDRYYDALLNGPTGVLVALERMEAEGTPITTVLDPAHSPDYVLDTTSGGAPSLVNVVTGRRITVGPSAPVVATVYGTGYSNVTTADVQAIPARRRSLTRTVETPAGRVSPEEVMRAAPPTKGNLAALLVVALGGAALLMQSK